MAVITEFPFWAVDGDIVEPSLSKQKTGWILGELVPYEWFNWVLNRGQRDAISEIKGRIMNSATFTTDGDYDVTTFKDGSKANFVYNSNLDLESLTYTKIDGVTPLMTTTLIYDIDFNLVQTDHEEF